jgi:drug/metabolite transporter (DMT)-like permease
MLVSSACFALMSFCVKLSSHSYFPLEILFYRTAFGALVLAGGCLVQRQNPLTPNLLGHVNRTLMGYASMCALFYAVSRLPLSTAVTLNYTSSIFFVLTCTLRLREPLEMRAMLSLVLGFAGILWLLQPTFTPDLWLPGVIGLISGVTAGVATFQVRELGRMDEAPWRIVFWFFTLSSLLGWLVVHFSTGFHSFDLHNTGPLAGVVICGLVGQLAMTQAYKDGNKFLAASLAYLTVVFSALLGWVIWGDSLGMSGVLAMLLIVLSGMMAARR